MSIEKPYHRNYRAIKPSTNSGYSNWAYIKDKMYAKNPSYYIRAFLLIQKDLINLFEYIEPANENLKTYSFRIHELLMRTCMEIETNFKAIFNENIYDNNDSLNMRKDYFKINTTHHLSSYKVIVPFWDGDKSEFEPFSNWHNETEYKPLPWYQAYNSSKHNRVIEFKQANFENLLNAVTGLLVLLSSQFYTEDFSHRPDYLCTEDSNLAIGDYFKIEYPTDWPEDEMYDFNWTDLKKEENRFQQFDYRTI